MYLPDWLDNMVESVVEATGSTAEVPVLSRSQVLRQFLRAGGEQFVEGEVDVYDVQDQEFLVDGPTLREQIPEHEIILHRREQFKEGEAQLRNLRIGFKQRWKNHFLKRFEGGFDADELRQFGQNARKDARILFPDDEHEEKRQELISWIDAVVENAAQAAEQSDWDPLDPEEMFTHHEGVERGAELERVDLDELLSDAQARISRNYSPDTSSMIDSLAKEYGISDDLAEQAVQVAMDLEKGNLERGVPELEQAADSDEVEV